MRVFKCISTPFGPYLARTGIGRICKFQMVTALSSSCGTSRAKTQEDCRLEIFERRQRLILENLCQVHRIARRIHVRLPKHVSFDDIVHSGVIGLIDAVGKFDPAKGVPFWAYAQIRIRGAILDSLREMDWGLRSLRFQARRIEQARSVLVAKLGRVPSEPEVAAHLVLRLDNYQRILTELDSLAVGVRQEVLEFVSQAEVRLEPCSPKREDPFQLCVRAEAALMLRGAINTLAEKERQSLVLYYFEEKTMKEIGGRLHISESRVSQIISATLHRLRNSLRESKYGQPRPG
jgi:RNA polymerase sigma factor for flagellar operon FliA